MNKTIFWKYTINPEDLVLTWDEQAFEKDLEIIKDSIWYFFPQYFKKDGAIVSYLNVIINWTQDRIEYVKELYKIEPNKVYSDWKEFHLVFQLKKWIWKGEYDRIWYVLSILFWWKTQNFHFYPKHNIAEKYSSKVPNKNLKSFLNKLFFILSASDKVERELSKHNYDEYQKTKEIPFFDILEKLWESQKNVDDFLNIHLIYWYPYEYLLNYFNSAQKVFDFFNKNFGLEFKIEEEIPTQIISDWVIVKESNSFFMDNLWYFAIDAKWNKTRITDFYIKVYYRIVDNNWITDFIVSLISWDTEIETKKIVWLNATSLTLFSDFIQKFWNYHFFGQGSFIKEFHKKITETKHIPIIKSLIWFWVHDEDWVIIFKNWLWDIKETLFTEKNEWEEYYFDWKWNGFYVVDKQWNPLIDYINEWIPKLNTNIINMDDAFDFVSKLYKDNSWEYLLILAFWIIGYMLYWGLKEPFPLIFSRWITASWKTTFNNLLQKIFWIDKAWLDFWNSSVFTMTVMLSHLIKFPYFLWEYRENIDQVKPKTWILRSVFDKSWQTKWKADQTMIKYNYYAIPVIDWEEMINDWAIRTRTLQKQFLHKNRIKWNFNKILSEGSWVLDWVLYTYLLKSHKKNYQKYLDEWFLKFRELTAENRIAENVALIYAWCMCFDKSKESLYEKVLIDLVNYQQKDYEVNSTSMQVIKALCSFLTATKNFENPVSILEDGSWFVIDWELFAIYCSKVRVELTLKIESYKEHLIAMWYDVGYVDIWVQMIYWINVPIWNIPKAFMVHPDIYVLKKKHDRIMAEQKKIK